MTTSAYTVGWLYIRIKVYIIHGSCVVGATFAYATLYQIGIRTISVEGTVTR